MTEWTTGEWYLAVTCKHCGWQFPLSRADQTLPQRPIWNRVYAPAVQHRHDHHDLVGKVASARFPRVSYYSTYTKENYTPVGEIAIVPTEVEIALKNKALDCYTTQIRINGVHFDAVRGNPEFMNRSPHPWESHAGA